MIAYWFDTHENAQVAMDGGGIEAGFSGVIVLHKNIDDAIMDGANWKYTLLEVELDLLPAQKVRNLLELACLDGKMIDIDGPDLDRIFVTCPIPAEALKPLGSNPAPGR